MTFSFDSNKSFLNQEFITFPSFHFHCSGFFLCAMVLSSDCNQYCCNRQYMYFIISKRMVRDYRAFILPFFKIHPSASSSCPLQAVLLFFLLLTFGSVLHQRLSLINLLGKKKKKSKKYSSLKYKRCCKMLF